MAQWAQWPVPTRQTENVSGGLSPHLTAGGGGGEKGGGGNIPHVTWLWMSGVCACVVMSMCVSVRTSMLEWVGRLVPPCWSEYGGSSLPFPDPVWIAVRLNTMRWRGASLMACDTRWLAGVEWSNTQSQLWYSLFTRHRYDSLRATVNEWSFSQLLVKPGGSGQQGCWPRVRTRTSFLLLSCGGRLCWDLLVSRTSSGQWTSQSQPSPGTSGAPAGLAPHHQSRPVRGAVERQWYRVHAILISFALCTETKNNNLVNSFMCALWMSASGHL